MHMILTPQEGMALCGLLAENATDIILKTDRDGFIVEASAGIARLGYPLAEMLVWPNLADLAGPHDAPALGSAHRAVVTGRRAAVCIEFARPAGGSRGRRFRLQMRARDGEGGGFDGRPNGALAILRDIEEHRALEERLFVAEMTDPLTGLTNRRAFLAMLGHLVAMAGRHSLALFDVDHFRAINRKHGLTAGDEVLAAVADFLRATFSARDTISRLGGGTFAVLMAETPMPAAESICHEVLTSLEAISRAASGGRFPLTASAGIAAVAGTRAGAAGCDSARDETLQRAELALFMARANGGNRLAREGEGRFPGGRRLPRDGR